MSKETVKSKKRLIVIAVNEVEYQAFIENKKKEEKSGQFLAYRALEKAGLFKQNK